MTFNNNNDNNNNDHHQVATMTQARTQRQRQGRGQRQVHLAGQEHRWRGQGRLHGRRDGQTQATKVSIL